MYLHSIFFLIFRFIYLISYIRLIFRVGTYYLLVVGIWKSYEWLVDNLVFRAGYFGWLDFLFDIVQAFSTRTKISISKVMVDTLVISFKAAAYSQSNARLCQDLFLNRVFATEIAWHLCRYSKPGYTLVNVSIFLAMNAAKSYLNCEIEPNEAKRRVAKFQSTCCGQGRRGPFLASRPLQWPAVAVFRV